MKESSASLACQARAPPMPQSLRYVCFGTTKSQAAQAAQRFVC